MKVSLFEDKIAFLFEEDIENGGFVDKTESGLLIQEDRSKQVDLPRWGIATQIGEDCKEVVEGDRILIEATMWTNGLELVEGKDFWVTRERNVIAIDQDK